MSGQVIKLKDWQSLNSELGKFWSKQEKRTFKKIERWLLDLADVTAEVVVEQLAKENLASFKKEVNFLVKMGLVLGFNPGKMEFLKSYGIRKSKTLKPATRRTIFPTRQVFSSSIDKLLAAGRHQEVLFLVVLLSSGRRGCEISRISFMLCPGL